jgi:4-amino-4-deoxy-L-arabinose transferase-like glycosyltransferase
MALALTVRDRQWLVWLIVAIVGVRLVTLTAYPLTDPTDTRYGQIARKMLETRQWIMPQFEHGVPFWGASQQTSSGHRLVYMTQQPVAALFYTQWSRARSWGMPILVGRPCRVN